MTTFLDGAYADAGIVPDRTLPDEVEVVRRRSVDGSTEFTVVLNHGTEDSREGPRAFAEKRSPQFKGR